VTSVKKPDQGLAAVLQVLRGAAAIVSGEYLAAQLGLSRAAVWKRVHRLKAQGYVIEGSPRRGYRLLSVPDKLLPEEVLQGLKTRLFRADALPRDPNSTVSGQGTGGPGRPEGTVVVAAQTEAGAGWAGSGIHPRSRPLRLPGVAPDAAAHGAARSP
jgi:BirA family biotin operon repressor/biotin-[acetyl-CoA-carboxylase] ligase